MLLEKSYTQIEEDGMNTLMRKFRSAGLAREDAIGGFNTFTGTINGAASVWPEAMQNPVEITKSWDSLWKVAGIPSPGGLPSSCRAVLILNDTKAGTHGRTGLGSLRRYSGPLGSTMAVNFKLGSEPNTGTGPDEGAFTVVVMPKTAQWTFSLESGTGFDVPDLVTRAQSGQPAIEGKPKKDVALATALKRVAGIDASPEGLGRKLLDVHREHALQGGAFEECAALINKGADITLRDQWGQTILMKAAGHGHVSLTKLLIEKGADLDETSSKTGHTPREMAQEVLDNIKSKGALNAHLQESLARYQAVLTLIDETSAARRPAPAPEPVVVEDTGPLKVRRPLQFKKPE